MQQLLTSHATCVPVTAAAGAPGMSGVTARTLAAHDGRQASRVEPGRCQQRGGGAQGAQVAVRASQGAR